MSRGFLLALAGFSVLLSACSTVRPPADEPGDPEVIYEQRAEDIAAWSRWGFRGRLSMDDGEDGGSGQLDWQTDGAASQLDFRGALGRGAWRLVLSPGLVRLTRSDGSEVESESVSSLVREEVGWQVPVNELAYWVRGLKAPGYVEDVSFDVSGRIIRLSQAGWTIEFERYRDVAGTQLPGRIKAVNQAMRIKLVPVRWTAPISGDSHV